MTDYRDVVLKMLAYLQQEVADHKSGQMMSMAESVHGEIAARAHLAKLESLIQAELVETVVDQGGGKALLKDLLK
jgi:hypothetical protein